MATITKIWECRPRHSLQPSSLLRSASAISWSPAARERSEWVRQRIPQPQASWYADLRAIEMLGNIKGYY